MSKKILAMLIASALILSTTACSGDDNTDSTVSENTANTANTAEAATTVEAATENETLTSFTLLDISADMIQAGVYAVDENNTELVFSLFNAPDNTPMTSLFVFPAEGEGDVICGQYTSESSTDENNIAWTDLTLTDVYTQGSFTIGVAESDDGQVFIYDTAGNIYEGAYLTADETVVYMGTAAALLD